VGLKPILRSTTSFSALTLLVGSFDPSKTVPEMTYNVFSGTLNPTHFTSSMLSVVSRWCIPVCWCKQLWAADIDPCPVRLIHLFTDATGCGHFLPAYIIALSINKPSIPSVCFNSLDVTSHNYAAAFVQKCHYNQWRYNIIYNNYNQCMLVIIIIIMIIVIWKFWMIFVDLQTVTNNVSCY